MKILFLSRGRTIEDQIGFNDAFESAESCGKRVEVHNLPYIGFVEQHGWDGLYNEVLRINDEWCPDIVFFQFFHGGNFKSPRECIRRLKAHGNRSPLVFGSQGDAFDVYRFGKWGRYPEYAMTELAACSDAFFSTSMGGLADYFVRKGARNVIFLPHAFSNSHFPGWQEHQSKKFDVVMLGSLSVGRKHIAGTLIHAVSRIRTARKLFCKYGNRFGLFGNGWRFVQSRGPVPFRDQVKVFQSARCAVDAQAPLDEVYYASDRPFFIAGAGVPLVQFYTPRFENILRQNEHAWYVRKGENVIDVCERVLAIPQEEMEARCAETQKFIQARHTQERRIDTMISVAEALNDCRAGRCGPDAALESLRLWHFLPEVDLKDERKFAVCNWRG